MARDLNYSALLAYAGECVSSPTPAPIKIGSGEEIPAHPVAVYVALGLQGEVLYVGSVCRPEDERGLQSRLEEHLRRYERFQSWDLLYVVPLKVDTPLETVRRIEGRIGAHLRPAANRALPRIGTRRRGPR